MCKQNRIHSIDALRGILILGMIIYHFIYNLTAMDIIPNYVLYNPFMNIVQTLGAMTFIIISGISAKFSRSNLKRGFKILAFGIIISIFTYIVNPDAFVIFGILHFLGIASILYAILGNIKIKPYILIILFFISKIILDRVYNIPHLWIFGIIDKNFISTDYFPIFPYIFIYYFGINLGDTIKAFPQTNLIKKYPNNFLSKVGKHTISIYILHQPILIIITIFIKQIIGE